MTRDTPPLTSRPSAFRRAAGSVGTVLGGLVRPLLKDPLSLFLIVASAALTILFFTFLGDSKPSSKGDPIALSTLVSRANAKQILTATLLDQDSRVVVTQSDGRTLWAAYPSSDAQTTALFRTLSS